MQPLRPLPYARQASDGTNPYVATKVDVADAFANPMWGWTGHTNFFQGVNPRLAPPNPFMRSPLLYAILLYVFAFGRNDPVTLAREACGAVRADLRRFLDNSGSPATRIP